MVVSTRKRPDAAQVAANGATRIAAGRTRYPPARLTPGYLPDLARRRPRIQAVRLHVAQHDRAGPDRGPVADRHTGPDHALREYGHKVADPDRREDVPAGQLAPSVALEVRSRRENHRARPAVEPAADLD